MITLKRTDSDNLDFKKLVLALDNDLLDYYKEEKSFYDQLNAIDKIKYAIVAYDENNNAVGCGAIKKYTEGEVEIKRMFVPVAYRGKGIASIILNDLENWACELNFKKTILETLKEKTYAIGFYKKNGYVVIPNFGEYTTATNSVCFSKEINS